MSNRLLDLMQRRHALRESLEKAESDTESGVDVESVRALIEELDAEIRALENPDPEHLAAG